MFNRGKVTPEKKQPTAMQHYLQGKEQMYEKMEM